MYLPKSKYQSNLTASPGALKIKDTSEPYVGPYFKTYTGRMYTGNSPSKTSQELVNNTFGISENFAINGQEVIGIPNEYDYVRDNNLEVQLKSTLPVPLYYPKPSPTDYTNGKFSRYFAIDKKTSRILEISRDVYKSMKSREPKYYYPKYKLFLLEWNLRNSIENRVNTSIAKLDSYLKDPSQFVR